MSDLLEVIVLLGLFAAIIAFVAIDGRAYDKRMGEFRQQQKQLADFCHSKGGMPIYAPGGYVTNCIGVCK
jgi:hypothetical protein